MRRAFGFLNVCVNRRERLRFSHELVVANICSDTHRKRVRKLPSANVFCGCRQVVRHELPKLTCAGSSPVTRSIFSRAKIYAVALMHRPRLSREIHTCAHASPRVHVRARICAPSSAPFAHTPACVLTSPRSRRPARCHLRSHLRVRAHTYSPAPPRSISNSKIYPT